MKNTLITLMLVLTSVAALAQSPGGVNPGGTLKLWVKADAGLNVTASSVTSWVNQADNTKNMIPSGSPAPVLTGVANYINFNPSVQFLTTAPATGTLYTTANILPANSNYSRFVVFNANASMTGFSNIIGSGSPAPPATSNISFLKNNLANTVGQWFNTGYLGGQAAYSPGVAEIGTSVYNSGVASGSYININGTTATSTTLTGVAYTATNVQLGAAYNLGGATNVNFFYGFMPEVIVYSSALSATEVRRVESYLAIKYGKTLAGNYLSSSGATIWTSGAGFDNNITGIGRDDNSALLQKQSQSENSGIQPIIAVGSIASTNALNGSTALSTDRSFLIWGDDNASRTFGTNVSLNGINKRMARIWKIQETGAVGPVVVALPASAVPFNMTNTSLLQSGTATFSSGVTTTPMTLQTINGASYYTATVDFTNGEFFSFGGLIAAPGGVNTNLVRWFRSDKDITTVSGNVSQWVDQANGVIATQATAALQPAYTTSGSFLMNFNPSVTFGLNTTRQILAYSETGMSTGASTRAVFGVAAANPASTNAGVIVSQGVNTPGNSYHLVRINSTGTPPYALSTVGGTFNVGVSTYLNRVPVVAYAGGPSGNIKLSYNGNNTVSTTLPTNSGAAGTAYIGNYLPTTNSSWDGDITEVIYYTADPATTEKQRIESYLALKYGITLASDYLASDGLTFPWKLADHTGYNNNIAGIGRDDNTALDQKQSKSSNTGNHVVFSLDKLATTSGANSGSFSTDLQFLMWGDNATSGTAAFATAPYTNRLNRVWKVVNTGGINQDLQVLIPTAVFPGSARTALMYITGSTFTTGNMLFANLKTVLNNGTYYFSYSLPAAQVNTGTFYITFVYYQTAPGGVVGESVWLKANTQVHTDGTSLDVTKEWVATTGLNAGQYEAQYTTGGVKPVYKTGVWNFNPVVRFNLGGIGTDYTNTGSAITTFTTVNNFGAVSGQGSPTSGEVRVLSMTGGTSADHGPGTGGFIPVIGGNPLRAFTNGSVTSVNFTTALNGANPGIATTMRTGPTAASGNIVNRLHAQWNGSAALVTASSVAYDVDYYALGGLADGSKTIRNTNSMFAGDIPEVIVYNTDLTATERQRVNSYLSIKYGVTLNQTTAQNYLASDGSTVYWNAVGAHATYKNNIAGIGMDNFTELLQKQSQSINTGDQVTISIGTVAATNETNTGTFSTDKQFLVWGDDAGSATTTTVITGFGGARKRMLRKWELQNTNSFNQQITVYYPTAGLTAAFGSNKTFLVYDDAAGFNGTSKTAVASGSTATINGVAYTSFTVTFPATGTLYFSFGMSEPAPTLTVGNGICGGTGTYSVSFSSNGTVTASAGTVSGNTITGIPVGTNVTITATSAGGGATTTAVVPSPASCPVANGCTPPALTAGNGVCVGGGNYSVAFSATSGATITVSPGTATVSGNTVTAPVGTNVTITATLGGCSSVVTVNSPSDCSTACATPSASFSAGACTGATYSVNFVKTSTSVVTASTGTVTGGGAGSTSGTISGVATGTAITATITESGCSVQTVSISAPSTAAPNLTTGAAVCSGAGTYSVSFNSNGIVTASAGTVSGNSVTGIPVGTNLTLTAKSTNGCGTTISVVPSPASCPVANGCTPPALTAGNGVCVGGGNYSTAISATSGATITVSPGTATVSGNTVTAPVGTNVTITATLGGCSSVVTVNSPSDCSTACATPSASFTAGACTGATYSVNFVKTSTSVVTASTGTVTGGGAGSTSGTISGVATGTAITATITETGCSVQTVTISAPSNTAPALTASNAVCSGTGTYSVSFSSNGIVTASAGTVSGNSVTGIPVGTNVTLTATSTNGCGTTTAVVNSPTSCPASNGCTPPALTAGNGVCVGGGNYSAAISATTGATITVSPGTATVSGNTVTAPVGTNVTITATLGGCSSVVTVNSPSDCSTACATPSASFSAGACTGATYSVNFVKTSTSVVTASTGTVTGGGAGSTSGTISGVATGTAITATVTEAGCSVQTVTISAPSTAAPNLTTGAAVCSGAGTYSVTFNSNGIVTASAGTVSGNSVTGIPVGTNLTLTAKSTNGCGSTTAVVPSPTSCPVANGCTPPALTAGNGVCGGGGTYSAAFSATTGATIAVSPGTATVSGNTVTAPVGTNVTITATLGGCSSVVTVNSPSDCSTACATPSASFSAGACAGASYSVTFVKTSTSVVTASTGTVTGGGAGSTSGTISGVATGTAITATITEPGCSVQIISISAPSTAAPNLTTGAAVCSGAGTYSVTFNSNGIVTASAGTVSGNSVTGIPVGTNLTLTAKSTNGCGTTTAVVPSPANCPVANGCTPPALTAGNGVCVGGGNYSAAISATTGATITVSPGTATVSGNTVTAPVGTNVTITATLGGCSSVVTVNSPSDCSTACATPSASFSAGACTGATYSVNFVKTSTSVVTASIGTVTGGGAGSTSGTISGVVTGTAITATITESGCSVQTLSISAPSTAAPNLTTGAAVCSGAGTYSVTFNSNGIVTASAGTVSGNSVTGIPVGTNLTLTAKSTNGCGSTTAVVSSPVSCPVANGCTPPALTAGNGVCVGGGNYSAAFSATTGASITVSPGTATVSGNTVTAPVGTNVTITATLGGCSSVVTVNSPSDCSTACATPSASFSAGACTGATYSVNFVKTSTSVVTASTGTVTGGGAGSTSGTISGVATGTAITATITETGCSVQTVTISAQSTVAPILTTANAVCSGAGTYSVSFSSNGIVTASAGTVSGNSVTGIPVGTNVTLTSTSTNSCATSVAVVTSPVSCPVSNTCTPPALSAGQGVCNGGGVYSVAFSADPGSTVSVSVGTVNGNSIENIPVGTNVVITATAAVGGCTTVIRVNSPADCSTVCNTTAVSFTRPVSNGATYSVSFSKRSTTVVTSSAGIVTGGTSGSTTGTITGIPVGVNITVTAADPSCSTNSYIISSPASGVLVNAKVFLQGAMVGSSMRTTLRTTINSGTGLPLVPLSQPYGGAPWNYAGTESVASAAALPANLTDWVLVELRDASSPGTVIATRAAFLLSNGDIVDMDGVSGLSFPTVGEGSYYIAIRHRNHLSIRTAAAQYLKMTGQQYDFTTAQAAASKNVGITTNEAMKDLGSGLYAMWGGNANANTNVRFSGPGNDLATLLSALSGVQSSTLSQVYNNADLNMDGNVRYSGPGNDNAFLLSILSGNQPLIFTQH